ncbi:hypothetical protein [Candidatus Similichlamydia laticola]|uniref:Uncharacterized protein n=1 Tax=Candidatus Similichlamydia laticola TaxID=2170265 RepID=A0A369KDD0_9BACT|nr:hypothetical protein [Candidatus Similichlamydia laticola]RDB31612.1 hypothetical protein HAT2_00281 [Candidatus Similichlamydia laticola]
MTIPSVSIPFLTYTQTGFCDFDVINYDEFFSLTSRISSTAKRAISRSKTCHEGIVFDRQKQNRAALLVLPKYVSFDSLDEVTKIGKLVIVMHKFCLYIGFVPFIAEGSKLTQHHRLLNQFHHYQLDSFALEEMSRIGVSEKGKSLFQLPLDAKLESVLGNSTIKNLSLMLLLDRNRSSLSLLCCKDPIPPILPIPMLRLQKKIPLPLVSEHLLQVKVSGLIDHNYGEITIPCLSIEDFKKKANEHGSFKESSAKGYDHMHRANTLYWEDKHLLVLPHECFIEPKYGLKGMNLFLIKGAQLELGFIPDTVKQVTEREELYCFHRSFLEEMGTTNRFIPGNKYSRLDLSSVAKVCLRQDSSFGISGISFFFLASKHTDFVALLCRTGNYELASINPMNPTENLETVPSLSKVDNEPTRAYMEYEKYCCNLFQEHNYFHTDTPEKDQENPEMPVQDITLSMREETKQIPIWIRATQDHNYYHTESETRQETKPDETEELFDLLETERERREIAVSGLLLLAEQSTYLPLSP